MAKSPEMRKALADPKYKARRDAILQKLGLLAVPSLEQQAEAPMESKAAAELKREQTRAAQVKAQHKS